MNAGEDGAVGFMQNLGGDRTQQERSERLESMSWHHYKAVAIEMGEIDDLAARIARQHESLNLNAPQFTGQEIRQQDFRSVAPGFGEFSDRGFSRFVIGQ